MIGYEYSTADHYGTCYAAKYTIISCKADNNSIKKHKTATIVAPDFNHSKIIQAVMKERAADLPFRRLLKKHSVEMRLLKEPNTEKGIITFHLIEIKGIKIADL